jgi:predicted short-subunit dehydrogenase-like oxidoreductase (DUF2520 family)
MTQLRTIGIVGAGRLGTALSEALREAGFRVDGPASRDRLPSGDAIILCVPDGDIASAAGALRGRAPLVGHTSGATPLRELEPALAAAFGLHPLQTFAEPFAPTDGSALARFAGAGCAVAGTTPEALAAATGLARALRMRPFRIEERGRAAYHAAASIASNFLVTLQAAAEEIAAGAGLAPHEARALLAPLVRRTLDNVGAAGPRAALTGPVARGDEATVERQRAAVADVAPALVSLFDALVEHTRAVAARPPERVAA